MRNGPVILIADDDDNAVVLLDYAFDRANIRSRRVVVQNGQEAIDYLSGAGIYADREKYPWPALMLLDLNMPLVDGFEVLKWWQDQQHWEELPIVVMSSSNRQSDIGRAMQLGATAYQVKPGNFSYLVEVAHNLRERWLKPRELVG